MDEDMASPFTPHLEALAGHLNNFQVRRLHPGRFMQGRP